MGSNISRFGDIGQQPQSSDKSLRQEESGHRYLKSQSIVNVICNHFSDNYGTISVVGFQNNDEFSKSGEENLSISFLNSINGENKGNIAIGNENKLFTGDYDFPTQSAERANADECEENLFQRQSTINGANDSAKGIGNENNVFKSDYDFPLQSGGENSNSYKGNSFCTNFYGDISGTTVIGDENKLFTSDDIELTPSSSIQEPSDITVPFCNENLFSNYRPTCQFALEKQYQNLSPYNQVPCCDDKEFQTFLTKYREMTNDLHYLRDYGLYKELNNKIKLGLKKEDAAARVVCLVEKSINLGHRKKLLQSEEVLKKALQQIPQSNASVASALTALCNLELASIRRRKNNYDAALMYINTAVQRMESLPKSEVYAYVIYERGSILTLKAGSNDAEDSCKIAEAAEGDLKQIISIFVEFESVIENLYVRKHIFALCKLAIGKLKCETSVDRNSLITDAAIRDAWNCIQRVTTKYRHQIPPAAEIQLKIAQSDYYYRLGKYEKAKMFATSAMVLANELSMKLELSRIQNRLEAITACLQRESD